MGKKGNLGNQLFQIASTIGIAQRYCQNFVFPDWEYEEYFESSLPKVGKEKFEQVSESYYHYHDWNIGKGNYDLYGYLQSEKYFDRQFTKKLFSFRKSFLQGVKEKQKISGDPKNILISVRRGDFVHHPWFYQLSYKYYLGALIQKFPDWKQRNLVFASDDISYCKYHFSFLPNAFFLDNLSAIEQLAFGSMCKDFIISNSTFSWWMAWLGEEKNSNIIRPLKNFRGRHSTYTNEEDYFPERWEVFDHQKFRIPPRYISLNTKGKFYALWEYIKYIGEKVREKSKKKFNKMKV